MNLITPTPFPKAGDLVIFEVNITNNGTVTANNVIVDFNIPECVVWRRVPNDEFLSGTTPILTPTVPLYDLTMADIIAVRLLAGTTQTIRFETVFAPQIECMGGAVFPCTAIANLVTLLAGDLPFNNSANVTVPYGNFPPIVSWNPPAPGAPILASVLIGTLYPSGVVSNQTIYVHGDVEIDQNLTFLNCVLVMDDNTRITVDATCHVEYSHFYNCGNGWRGIFVIEKRPIYMYKSIVEDAEIGILGDVASKITAENNVFNNNHVGISIHGDPLFTSMTNNISTLNDVRDNMFVSDIDLLRIAAFLGQHGWAGIEVHDLNTLLSKNAFMNLNNGIWADNSSLMLSKNICREILNFDSHPQPYAGSGIYAQSTGNKVLIQSGLGNTFSNALPNNNTFEECTFGIYTDAMATEIEDNRMGNIENSGIFNIHGFIKHHFLNNNLIYTQNNGIELLDIWEDTVSVTNNVIFVRALNNLIPWGPPIPGGMNSGMFVTGNSFFGFTNTNRFMVVSNNEIFVDNGYFGINNWGTAENLYIHNSITSATNQRCRAGISTLGAQEVGIGCNFIQNGARFGIRNDWSPDENISCNTLRFLPNAIGYEGQLGNTYVHGNLMTGGGVGIWEDNLAGTWMANQINTGNVWNPANNPAIGIQCSAWPYNWVLGFPIYQINPFHLPAWGLNNPAFDMFTPDNTNLNYSFIGGTPHMAFPLGGISQPDVCGDDEIGDHGFADICEVIVGNSPTESELRSRLSNLDSLLMVGALDSIPVGSRWILEKQLYKGILQHPELGGANSLAGNWMTHPAQADIAAFMDFQQAFAAATPSILRSEIQAQQSLLRLQSKKMMRLDSIQAASLDSLDIAHLQTQKESLAHAILTTDTTLLAKQAQMDEEMEIQANTLWLMNDSLPAATQPQINDKIVQRIFLETFVVKNFVLTDAQIEELENIIYQCPADGGDAVFQARILYMLHNRHNTYNDDACYAMNGERKAEASLAEQRTVVVYPNPAQDHLTFSFSDLVSASSTLTIFNTMGQVIEKKVVSETQIDIDVAHYVSGTYYYQLRTGTEQYSGIFIIE